MNRILSYKELGRLLGMYPKGARVELIEMDDPYRHIPEGTRGTVVSVDDIGTVHVDWDNGSTLGAAYGVDRIRRIEDEE